MQTWAILIDAYRELSSRKLFWLGLFISCIVAATFGAVGLTPTGLTLLFWDVEAAFFNSTIFKPAAFYKMMFMVLGVSVWLTWGATILAILSTASIIPDFVSSGSIELMLSKPISRLRLFLTKYAVGLLFVAIQSAVFCAAAFMVIGLRGGVWELGLFLAVPFVVLIFSFLHCVCALVGMLTRSTLAAMILTGIFWLALFSVHATESFMLTWRIQRELEVESGQKRLDSLSKQLADRGIDPAAPADESSPEPPDRAVSKLLDDRARVDRDLAELTLSRENARRWHRYVFAAKTVLPKTSDSTELLRRILVKTADLPRGEDDDRDMRDSPMGRPKFPVSIREFADRQQQVMDERPAWWILGTSLGFEAMVLGIACWIFARRDF